jgi:CRP/FNR family transcriptional regulator, cyclic AMP receptor protein
MTIGVTRVPQQNWIDHLPEDARAALRSAMQPRAFASGALIYNRTEQPNGLYLIRSGSALFQIDGANGNRLLLKIVRENQLLGETVAYDAKPAPVAVEARSQLRTDFVPTAQLALLRERYAEIDRALAAVAVQNLRAALVAIEELNLMNLRERTVARLASLCAETGHPADELIRLDLTQSELASMLGASRPATNGVLGNLERIGMIARNFRHIDCLPALFCVQRAGSPRTA